MKTFLGLDIGSVNIKACLIDQDGELLKKEITRITSDPVSAVNRAMEGLGNTEITGLGVSGSGSSVIPSSFNAGEYTSPLAVAAGLLHNHPDARTIIQLGGHSSLIVRLEDGLKKPWKVVTNPLCAAGTGRFIEQQAYRLGISMEDFSRLALEHNGSAPRIAARCSVFAKSDLIHLQQKGVALPAMLYALCESVARMVVSLNTGIFDEPVYLVGGMSAGSAIVKAIEEAVSERNGHEVKVNVPDGANFTEALGAALLARDRQSTISFPILHTEGQNSFQMSPLPAVEKRDSQAALFVTSGTRGYLGVDIGSTSTKAVILDETGKHVLAKTYIMTSGRPVDAIRQVSRNLLEKGAGMVDIAGVGVTGSGRYLIGHFIGADLVKNEITAQTRGAVEIDPDADIIEIGGQDSKLVIKRKGVVVDYQMNKACAAGTGSFIDELADMLGVKVTNGDFARLAFKAPHTIDLGTRCAAFMGQSVAMAQQEGVPLEVIAASLAGSIAKNYLSKVVGHRKLGDKVILTGAVFYNDAVVAAFREQLEDRLVSVAEHCEVSGAIGAALLSKEAACEASAFKGFERIIEQPCDLSTFICQACDNNCTITRMSLEGEENSYYGSRCDRYDSSHGMKKQRTFFDERDKLLFKDYKETSGKKVSIGIPRALLTYDFAPLLIGFLNGLDARVVVSGKTTAAVIAKSGEIAYSDSCFPLKLMHGHAASLKGKADYILYPSAIRLGLKEGDSNQKYTCPLVQSAPFIVREVLGLGKRLIAPVLDFSLGDGEVIANLTAAAQEMGFSLNTGKRAALAGIEAQNRFYSERDALGTKLLQELRGSGKTGVVILSRSYMSQDSGANLGIAETLANLGVVPIPLDFLPLDSVNPADYSDRPYWSYEGKLISASAIIAKEPNLYGLMITNFGCGPNSFILPVLEDIMGGKPMGQLEIDEHAAEAGLVTRLEAFVDTITSYSATRGEEPPAPTSIRRSSASIEAVDKIFVVPHMAPFIEVAGAVLQAAGGRVLILPEPDEENLLLANRITSGTECLPYRVTLGDYIKFFKNNPAHDSDVQLLMAGSYGPCRLGKYALEQDRILRSLGYNARVHTTVSNNAYRDINVSSGLLRYAMNGVFAADWLERLLWRTRPYEKESGEADRLFTSYINKLADAARKQEALKPILADATKAFASARDKSMPGKPLIGINGEIYLRTNTFSNGNLVRVCEAAGLEVVVSPMSEWIKYTSYRNLEDNMRFRRLKKIPASFIKHSILKGDDKRLSRIVEHALDDGGEPSVEDVLSKTRRYLSPRCGSEAVLSIGAGLEWLENPRFAGVISVMPHGCMPGGIVASLAEKFAGDYHKPWISLTYDGIMENNNQTKIANFAEVIRYCAKTGR